MTQEETPVLIVGGSLVGLTSALLLGHLGVPSLVVERHPGTAIHARAGHFQLGTTEMLRQVGLERTVREASAKTYDPTGGIIAVESAVAPHRLREAVRNKASIPAPSLQCVIAELDAWARRGSIRRP